VLSSPSENSINLVSFTRAVSQCLKAVMWLAG
jgi:hypothetical protein